MIKPGEIDKIAIEKGILKIWIKKSQSGKQIKQL